MRVNGKQTEQYRARQTEIVDAAATLFARKGYSPTGIREISEAVGLDLGGLYYYIESKESLLENVHDRVMDPLLEATRSIEGLNVSAVARLRLVSEVVLENIIEHPDHAWVTLHEYRAFTGDRRERFRAKRLEFESIVSRLFMIGAESREFLLADLRSVAMAFIGMHNYTYLWVRRGGTVDPKILSRTYCDIFFDGIRSVEDLPALSNAFEA